MESEELLPGLKPGLKLSQVSARQFEFVDPDTEKKLIVDSVGYLIAVQF